MEGRMPALAVLLSMCLLLLVSTDGVARAEQVVHSKTFYSPVFELGPGEVTDTYTLIDMPTGHIALRDYFAEVVDENDNSVPLSEVYLHHWVVFKKVVNKEYKQLLSSAPKQGHFDMPMRHAERMAFHPLAEPEQEKSIEGTCQDNSDSAFFGLGSETRRSDSAFPAPYGLVTGDPATIPAGKEEAWYLNLHAISTKDVVDITSCYECLCEAYGVTQDSKGQPLSEGYIGGLYCCYDKTQCAMKANADPVRRKLYLKYTVMWADWDESVIPLRTYSIDLTDGRTSLTQTPNCQTEYVVEKCDLQSNAKCIDHRHTVAAIPKGGDLIFANLHQHAGGLGGILYDKDGVVLCVSDPIYGQGTAAGDEAGYVVGMTGCYPKVGTMYVEAWKELHADAYYSNEKRRTGVMSIFMMRVADPVAYIAEVTE